MRLFRVVDGLAHVCLLVVSIDLIAPGEGSAQEISGTHAPPDSGMTVLRQDSASVTATGEYVPEWYSMITNIPGDWVRYGRITFTTEHIPAIAGMAAVTIGLIALDQKSWEVSDRWYRSSPVVKNLSDDVEWVGDGRSQFGLAAAFAAYGFLARDDRALRTASQTVEAILACGTVVQVLKHITGRQSPYLSTREGGRWDFFPNQIEYHKHVPAYDAYPSGHIATALTTLIVVAENYPEWWWARPLGYTLVGLLGVSMVNTGIHWYSDYPLGLALGYTFGMLAAHPREMGGLESERAPGSLRLSFAPILTPEGAGVGIMLSF